MLLRDNSGYPGGLFSFQQLPAALKPQATTSAPVSNAMLISLTKQELVAGGVMSM